MIMRGCNVIVAQNFDSALLDEVDRSLAVFSTLRTDAFEGFEQMCL